MQSLLNETAVSPATKTALSGQLSGVLSSVQTAAATGVSTVVAEVANGETSAVAGTIANTAAEVAGVAAADAVAAVPVVGGMLAPEAEALVSHAVGSAVAHLEAVFESHNAKLLAALAGLVAPAPAASSETAQTIVNNA